MNCKIITIFFASILVLSCGADELSDYTANVKASSTTLGGVNCLTTAAFNVEDIANNFLYDIQICNVAESAVIKKIKNLSKTITKRTAKVIDADDNVCQNSVYEDSEASVSAPSSCTNKMNTLMVNLYTAVSATQIFLNSNPTIEDSCSEIAANTLKLNLPILTETVGTCASL